MLRLRVGEEMFEVERVKGKGRVFLCYVIMSPFFHPIIKVYVTGHENKLNKIPRGQTALPTTALREIFLPFHFSDCPFQGLFFQSPHCVLQLFDPFITISL